MKVISRAAVEVFFKLLQGKAVTFGSSYSGTLAAWFRQQNPELINVAVASSAPMEYEFLFPRKLLI